jgi:hypothetical protein
MESFSPPGKSSFVSNDETSKYILPQRGTIWPGFVAGFVAYAPLALAVEVTRDAIYLSRSDERFQGRW